MKKEVSNIVNHFREVLQGEPWFGRSVYSLLSEINEDRAGARLAGQHSMKDILYHMNTWTMFAVKRLEDDEVMTMEDFEKLDWRNTHDPSISWNEGLKEFRSLNDQLIDLLNNKSDQFLEAQVKFRTYNFRYLMQGLIEHHIYHIGQIAILEKIN